MPKVNRCLFFLLLVIPCFLGNSQSTSTQSSFQSNRLNALLERRGWIRIGLDESASELAIVLPAGGSIELDGKIATCPPGTVKMIASGNNVNVTLPGQSTVAAREVTLVPAGQPFQYEGRSYRGKARIKGGRSLAFFNEVMIDDWLKGVLPAEIGSDSPLEALKAQAVTARSEAIFRLLSPPHADKGYDFCTGVHCQAYKGIGEENAEIQKACDATLGYVLVAENDVVNAVYHNVCGGVTAGAEDVWNSKPLPGISPIFDTLKGEVPNLSSETAAYQFIQNDGANFFCYSGNPDYANYAKKYFRWSKTLTAAEAGRMAGVGTLTDIQVTERRPSGRVRKLTVVGSRGTKTIERELPIRNVFDLWSGLFVLKLEQAGGRLSTVTFVGAGNGHGVGLCQHGAREIARRGGTFDQILGHYYKGAKLRRVYRP